MSMMTAVATMGMIQTLTQTLKAQAVGSLHRVYSTRGETPVLLSWKLTHDAVITWLSMDQCIVSQVIFQIPYLCCKVKTQNSLLAVYLVFIQL